MTFVSTAHAIDCSRFVIPDRLNSKTASPLSPPLLFGKHRNFFRFQLHPNSLYTVEFYRQHPYGIPGRLLALKVEAKSDWRGILEPGVSAVTQYLRERGIERGLTPLEKTFADEILLKTASDTSFDSLPADIAEYLNRNFDADKDEVYVVVRSATSHVIQGTYVQQLNAIDPRVAATKTALNPKRVGQGGQNLDGFLIRPASSGSTPVPLVVVWGGSGGTIPQGWAQALAHNGIAALGVRYFTYDPQDPSVASGAITHLIDRTPLEIFKTAVEYGRKLEGVDAKQISVLGESRGGEGALLFAQYYGNELGLKSVIANRPFHFAVGSKISESYVVEADRPSWTYKGKDIGFAALPDNVFQLSQTIKLNEKLGTLDQISWWQPEGNIDLPLVNLRPLFEQMQPGPEALIDVGSFKGNILALGGTHDLVWPADVAVRELAKQRLGRKSDYFINVRGGGHYVQVGRASNNLTGELQFELGLKGKEKQGLRIVARDGGVDRMTDGIHELVNEHLVIQSILHGQKIRHSRNLPFIEFLEQN